MATWHVFHDQPKLTQWLLRKHGCFSVDREANDIRAFRLASEILQQKPQPLVVFPEGEIYHCNEHVTPFREGAAAIAVAAARKSTRPIVCIPCAMSYRYVEDPTPQLAITMGELEEAIYWRRRTSEPLEKRIYRFAEALLGLKEVEYFSHAKSGPLPQRIRDLGDHILSAVESRHGLSGDQKQVPERVKAARRTVIEQLSQASDEEDGVHDPQRVEALNHDLEDLFLVVQSFSYPGDYVEAKPSIERMAETLDKFEEDVLKKTTASIKAKRTARVQFGEPVEVSGDRKYRNQTTELTSEIENRVQTMLDQWNH